MRKLLPVLVSAGTVMAIVLSAGVEFHREVRVWQVMQVDSAEVLRVHAANHAMIDEALGTSSVPPFTLDAARTRVERG